LLENHSDEEIELMIEFLEKGREMVEQELERLEQAGPQPGAA
jgi:hypothetical protein